LAIPLKYLYTQTLTDIDYQIDTSAIPQRSYKDEIFTMTSIISGHWSEPFIHLPAITKSVPELVGLAHQYRVCFEDSPKEEGPELKFQERFIVYQRELPMNRMQWLRMQAGSYDSPPPDIQGEVYKMMGFSTMDIAKIGKAMGAKFKGSYIYEYVPIPLPCFPSPLIIETARAR